MYIIIIAAGCLINLVASQPGKCDQTPPGAIGGPSKSDGTFTLSVVSKSGPNNVFLPDQTYILILSTSNLNRSFTSFMITAEDPDVDNSEFIDPVDVGNLKTLDTDLKSRYSERCFNTIENTDYSDKYKIEIHWVSPKTRSVKKVRIRASVGENAEAWYGGEELTVVLYKDNSTPQDSPPLLPTRECNLCSEARYEVIFRGLWSRVSHPSHYPNKPDINSYSHMIGASHAYDHVIWKQGVLASEGLKLLAETGEVSLIEREIIQNMSETGGTRTLIRGRRRRHPEMFEPSHSLFRVDRVHHLFSIAVAMRPSPDWFLGTSMYELCTEDGWLQPGKKIPLYPWDAGTTDGISYESPTSTTTPQVPVERVAVGSFDPMSPFYQLNLNDLHAFAELEVNRLEVFPLDNCDTPGQPSQEEENKEAEESQAEEPLLAESKLHETIDKCRGSIWGQWSECTPLDGVCGPGKQLRTGHVPYISETIYSDINKNNNIHGEFESCSQNGDSVIQEQNCNVPC